MYMIHFFFRYSQTFGWEGVAGERHQKSWQEKEENSREEGGQKGGKNAIRHLADVHHHVDAL